MTLADVRTTAGRAAAAAGVVTAGVTRGAAVEPVELLVAEVLGVTAGVADGTSDTVGLPPPADPPAGVRPTGGDLTGEVTPGVGVTVGGTGDLVCCEPPPPGCW